MSNIRPDDLRFPPMTGEIVWWQKALGEPTSLNASKRRSAPPVPVLHDPYSLTENLPSDIGFIDGEDRGF